MQPTIEINDPRVFATFERFSAAVLHSKVRLDNPPPATVDLVLSKDAWDALCSVRIDWAQNWFSEIEEAPYVGKIAGFPILVRTDDV